jgi:quercetin dioxygenase-like cupin family protein
MLTRRLALQTALGAFTAIAAARTESHGQVTPAGVARREILRQALPNAPGKEVVVISLDYAPGAASSLHRHPSPVFGYVARGAIVSQIGDQPVRTYQQGEMFYEPPGGVHSGSHNASTTAPATLVAFFVADPGQTLTEPVAG